MSRRTEATASDRLARYLSRTGRRLRARRAIEAAASSLPYSLAACAIAALALRAFVARGHLALEMGPLLAGAGGLVLLVALGAALAAAAGRFAHEELALLVDHELDTREALATATWLRGSDEAEARADRALEALDGRSVAQAVPARRQRVRGTLVAIAALSLAFLLPMPGPPAPPPPAEADPTVQAAAAELEKEVEKIVEELEDRDAPESVQRLLEEILQQAESLKRSTVDRDEAALSLKKLEQAVQEERDRRQAADGSALERALSAMEQSSLTRRAARAAQMGDSRALEQELAALAEAFREGVNFDEREIDRLSVRLREAADELRESSHQELADRLEELADALESGDAEAAAKLFEELLDSGLLEEAGNDAAANEALGEAQALIQQALAQLGRARPDQLLPDPAQVAAEALLAQAETLEKAGADALAGQLREIAEALAANDLDRAEQLTEDLLASGQCRNPTGSKEGDQAAREAEGLLAEVLDGIRQGKAMGPGGGAGGRDGRMAWSGRRTRSGAPIIGKDWGTGTTNEATPNRPAASSGNQSDRQSKETSDWVEAYEALYESTRLDDAKGRATRVGGLIGEGEHVAVPVWTTAGGPGDPQLPLVKLPPSYVQASEEALAKETIPAGYRDSVRRYFESLGGNGQGEKGVNE